MINKKMDCNKLMPDFRRFTKKNSTVKHRPVLNNVYNDGEFTVVCNGSVMLRINNKYLDNQLPVGLTNLHDLSLTKQEKYEYQGNHYPDLSRLIPESSVHDSYAKLYYDDLRKTVKTLKELKKQMDHYDVVVKCTFIDHKLILSYTEELWTNSVNAIEIGKEEKTIKKIVNDIIYSSKDSFTFYANINYLITVFEVMKKLVSGLNTDHVTIGLINPLRPITFVIDDVATALLLPIRVIENKKKEAVK